MEKLKENIKKTTCKAEEIKYIAKILEDYFFNNVGNKEVNKYMFLAMTVVEKTTSLELEINNLLKIANEVKKWKIG